MKQDESNLRPGPVLSLLAVALGLTACADLQQIARTETVLLKHGAAIGEVPEEAQSPDTDVEVPEEALATSVEEMESRRREERAVEVVYRGTDAQVSLPEPQAPVRFVGDDVSLNFEQAPLDEVTHAVLSDTLGVDYIIDRPLQGKVTLRTRTPIPRDELLIVLESLLKAHGALLIRGRDGRYLVSGSAEAATIRPGVSNASDESAGYSTIVIPLRFISATAMAEILAPLAEKQAFVRVDNSRNILMLAGTRAQLSGWLDIINTFDVDMLAGMSVGLFPLENADVEEAVATVNGLLEAAGGEAGDLTGIVRVLPMDRLNSILVVTPRAHYLDRVGTWIERLDVDPDVRFEKRLFVYPVQNTTATRLAQLLNSIYAGGAGGGAAVGGGSGGLAAGTGRNAGVAPGLSPESIGGGGATSSIGGAARGGASGGRGNAGQGARAAAAAMTASNLGGGGGAAGENEELADVRVVADEENNALMIYATGKQYDIVKEALEQLDVVPTQVIIEASIMEVQLTDDLRYGLEWSFENGFGSNYSGAGQLTSSDTPFAALTGFSYSVTNSAGDIRAVLNALSEESLINVISTPSVMVLDNHTAFISVGDQIPIRQGRTVGVGGNAVENITYRDTGVQLSVRPSVNAGGLITMDIEQSVIDVGAIDSATGQRAFLDRTINSRVAVRTSESVVLGGLIRENASVDDSGVPILHKVPVVGALFGSTNTENRRTELLVIITPRALYSEAELREVSAELREQVRFMELLERPPATGVRAGGTSSK
ncbi:MAG: type II secretion system secretin GspD [Pseudomonadota bacterium]